MQENKENLRSLFNRVLSPLRLRKTQLHTPEKVQHNVTYNDSPVLDDPSLWHQQSETTFETIEQMCENTLSDPTNPIHEYLSDWESKKSHSSTKSDEEVLALHRLFDEFGIENRSSNNLENQTQLNEIEPPSCLWDNTVNNESHLTSSPVKKIGQLRPSTILEESGTESIASTNSYQTAEPINVDTASSDQYETANESQSSKLQKTSTVSSKSSTDSGRSTNSRPDASAYFELFPLRQISYPSKLKEPRIYNQAIFQTKAARYNTESEEDSLDSSNDTSRDVSFVSDDSLERSERKQKSNKYMDDSLEIKTGSDTKSYSSDIRPRRQKLFDDREKSEINDDESSVIVISDDETDTTESDDLNKGFVRNSMTTSNDSVVSSESSDINVSHEFNNTLEEIEYIMNQGKKYLAASNMEPNTPSNYMKHLTVPTSPSPLASPATPCTVLKKPKSALGNKSPISPLHSKAMLKAQRLDHRFDHVVSPIRAYIHNTPKSPMTSSVKVTQSLFDSKFSRESRMPTNWDLNRECCTPSPCSLPRKAYISADYKHIVDQRSPISIPGGDKIHNYLEPGMVPSVLKHDCKITTNLPPRQKSNVDMNSESLANFSLESGDMSILLLKDANEFGA